MRTTEIFTVIAAILVLVIMRSKAEMFTWYNSKKSKSKKVGTGIKGRKGMVYGKRGNAVSKADFDDRLDSTRKSFAQDMKYYKTYKAEGNANKANAYWNQAQEEQDTLSDMGYGKRAAGMMKAWY